MPHITRQRVGGLTFIRLHFRGRTFVVSYCETLKHNVVEA